jgi:hypothetical protein
MRDDLLLNFSLRDQPARPRNNLRRLRDKGARSLKYVKYFWLKICNMFLANALEMVATTVLTTIHSHLI